MNCLIATQQTRTKAIPEGMVRFRLLCGDFLLPNPAPHLENRKTVCMGYPAMTPQGRAGKRRRKEAGKPCGENGNCHPLTSCVQNEHMRRNGRLSTRWGRRNQCGQNVYIDSVRITLNLDLTFCQATVKSGGLRKP